MTIEQAAQALEAWAKATCPTLVGSYDHQPATKSEALPDVVVDVRRFEVNRPPANLFPSVQIQQVVLARVWTADLVVMVPPEPADAATDQLRTIVDQLTNALHSDLTLGARVFYCSPVISADFDPPFVVFDDGTEGRATTVHLNAMEPIPEGDV